MSSVIIVQVGQCGNQLGDALWDALSAATGKGEAPSPFFTREGKARCVLVDAEPKVVEALLQRNPKRYHPDCVALGQCGRGNHWALGYYGLNVEGSRRDPSRATQKAFVSKKDQREDDSTLLPKALWAIHREATRVDQGQLEAIIVLHSMAGGTGSGLASRLMEKIRLHFSQAPMSDKERQEAEAQEEADGLGGIYGERRRAMYVVAIGVAPQVQGENALQGINVAMSLHSIHRSADAIIILRNDDVFNAPPLSPIKPCQTFEEANAVFVHHLMPLLQFGLSPRVIGYLIEKAAPAVQYKYLSIVPLPQKNYARFRRCAALSAAFQWKPLRAPLGGGGGGGDTSGEAVPYRDIHTEKSSAVLKVTHSELSLSVPRAYYAWLSQTLEASQATLVNQMSGVMVLNEVEELNRSLMFPLLRDAAMKISARAFLVEFLQCGVSEELMMRAVHQVAQTLLYEGT